MASSAARWRTSTPSQLSGSLINSKSTRSCADGRRTSVSLRGPEDIQLGRLAEDQAGRRRRARRIEAQAGKALQEAADRRVRLQPREVHPDADVGPAFSRRTSKRSGSANALGSRLAAATETLTRSPSRTAAPPSSTSAVAYRSTMAAAGSSRSDSSIALGSSPGPTVTSASCSGCDSRCTIALAIMPSVVSMPPKSITAAFEMTAERSRPPAASASSEEPGPRSRAGSMAACRSANAARPAAGTSPPAVTSVTAATIASYQPRTAPVPASGNPSAWVTIAAASGPAKARRSSAAPAGSMASISRSTSRATTSVKRSRTGCRRNGRANGARWRACASPSRVSMLGPTTCPVEKRGSSTVNVSAAPMTCSASSRRRTSQPPSAGTHASGARSRNRARSA